MIIKLVREQFTLESTIGSLYIDGKFFCYTLEDTDRMLDASMDIKIIEAIKVAAKTAIPTGSYTLAYNMSKRFKKMMLLLLNVKGFAGVRIHAGNTAKDTDGCILLGKTRSLNFIGNSRKAVEEFEKVVVPLIESNKVVTLIITRKQ